MSYTLTVTDQEEIRVLAVRQPWASLIVEGLKTIEVRNRPTNIRERVAIYASSKKLSSYEKSTFDAVLDHLEFHDMITVEQHEEIWENVQNPLTKCIIGSVEINNCWNPNNTDVIYHYTKAHFCHQIQSILKLEKHVFGNLQNL